jgi:hypothetical protein
MEPEAMTMPPSSDPWAALNREVERATPAECPSLLGELERLKAALWLRMAAPAHRQTSSQYDCLLTAAEVAQRLRVTKEYVYRNAPKYPFTVREGRYVRFSQAGLARYLERHQGK